MIPHRTIFSGCQIPNSERQDFRSERSDLRSERPDLRSERSELRSERVLKGGGRKPEKIVLCGIIGHLPLRGRCPKTAKKSQGPFLRKFIFSISSDVVVVLLCLRKLTCHCFDHNF